MYLFTCLPVYFYLYLFVYIYSICVINEYFFIDYLIQFIYLLSLCCRSFFKFLPKQSTPSYLKVWHIECFINVSFLPKVCYCFMTWFFLYYFLAVFSCSCLITTWIRFICFVPQLQRIDVKFAPPVFFGVSFPLMTSSLRLLPLASIHRSP